MIKMPQDMITDTLFEGKDIVEIYFPEINKILKILKYLSSYFSPYQGSPFTGQFLSV
jgi:hypothetical protein